MTDDFVRYAQPLVGDDMLEPADDRRPAAADAVRSRSTPSKKLPEYVPQADRKK